MTHIRGDAMSADCSDQIVLVTGGSTGLGRAIALESARRGAKAVIINYSRSASEADKTADAVKAEGATTGPHNCKTGRLCSDFHITKEHIHE